MCGIVGHIATLGQRAREVDLQLLRHRGPNAAGSWTSADGRVWFGHTRLAIVDLSDAGVQPMRDETNGNVIVFNGEIYNHLELRRELIAAGIRFHGQSDTETLLRGFGVWGTSFLFRLRGMFAFAIWNGTTGEVTLCRDRFGIKPLYVGRCPDGSLAFSSEIRTLLNYTGREISRFGVAAYLQRGACPHEALLFENICEFPSGSWAALRPSSSELRTVRFWPVAKGKELLPTKENEPFQGDAARHVRTLLEDAVQSHLQSDVPVACFLSGGIDSSVITALAARHLPDRQLATFSVGFSESEFDESRFATQMANQYGTEHHHIHLSDAEKLSLIERAVAAMDLPSTDGVNTFIVSHFVASAGYRVVLSGLGADEIFGGYPIFRDFWLVRGFAGTPNVFRKILSAMGRGRHILTDIPEEKTGESLSWWWRRNWSGDRLEAYGFPTPCFLPEPCPPLQDAMGELSWGEASHYMRDMLLRDSDAMSMAHSLEIRVPFLDNALVSNVLNYPSSEKFDPNVPKKLLIRATNDLLPSEIWNRPKMGFSLPMRKWMLGPLLDFCKEGLDQIQETGLIDQRGSMEIWQDFERARFHWAGAWALVVLGHYLKTNP